MATDSEEKRPIFGGLNSDNEDRILELGDYRLALNIRNGSSDNDNIGAIENVRGNEKVVFTPSAGNNTCIGEYLDEKTQTIFFFIHNDNTPLANHSILKFFPKTKTVETILVSDSLNFNKDKLITHVNLIEDKLYWTDDFNPPRKINVEKSNDTNKNRTFNLYFGLDAEDYWLNNDVTYHVIITTPGPAIVFNADIITITAGTKTTYEEVAKAVARAINEDPLLNTFIKASSCGKSVEGEFLNTGGWNIVFTEVSQNVLAVPQNYYLDLDSDRLSQIKPPPSCEPKIKYVSDASKTSNLIQGNNYQFRYLFVYDDFEKSVLSPISCLSVDPGLTAPHVIKSPLNGVEIDFTNELLNDINWLSLIKKVDLFVRRGNDGEWKKITTLEQDQFGILENKYVWFNDNASTVISNAQADKYFDSVPLLSSAQEFVKNRLYHANTLEGYDPVCVEAKVDITYELPQEQPPTFTIEGSVAVSARLNGSGFDEHQPIWNDGATGPVFGGMSSVLDGYVHEIASDYDQIIPLGGFVLYLAGTEHHAISEQSNPLGLPTTADPGVVFDGDDLGKRNDIRNAMTGSVPDRPQSTFSITGVPVGRYMLRMASHLTIESDLQGLGYQKTSTYFSKFNTLNYVGFQLDIEVTATEIIVHEPGGGTNSLGDYDIGELIVEDLTDVVINLNDTIAVDGYLTDDDINIPVSPTRDDLLSDTRIERASIRLTMSSTANMVLSGRTLSQPLQTGFSSGLAYTDHNGFYFAAAKQNMDLDKPTSTSLNVNFTNSDLYDGDAVSWGGSASSKKLFKSILRVTEVSIDTDSRTIVNGSVEDTDGNPIIGATIVPTYSQPIKTDLDGDFSVIIYGDTEIYIDSGNIDRTRGGVLAPTNETSGYIIEFTPTTVPLNMDIGPADFNISNQFTVSPAIIVGEVIFGETLNKFKRGWDGQFGLLYFDFANRQTAVDTIESLEKHILFYTEANESGSQENQGTPTLIWSINNLPPAWATHYQWVRTKNEGVTDYLQVIVNETTYEDDEGSPVSFATGTKMVIDISNLADYKIKYPNSKIGITPDDEYRVRFIKDSSGVFYDEYTDLQVVEATGSTITTYIDSDIGDLGEGALIEIYRPGTTSDVKLYYEFGECHEIIDGFHQGETQNQCHWQFDNNVFQGGNLGLVGSVEHCFQIGDVINIAQATGFTHSSYEGEATIISIPDNFNIVTNKTFISATPTEPGIATSEAIGEFDKGDAYYRNRTMRTNSSGSVSRFIDDACASDFYDSNSVSIGRLQAENPDQGQVRRDTHVQFSNKIFPETKINQLNSFDSGNAKTLPQENGEINKLQLAENVLIAIHEFRWTTMYIEERLLTQPDGTTDISVSDDVIGSFRSLRGKYGTINPESVREYEGHVWAWDANKGEVVRYSNNGLEPISNHKMSNYFATKSKEFLTVKDRSKYKVYSVFDPFFGEYILSFSSFEKQDSSINPAETIAFSENISRWTTKYSYLPEFMGRVGQGIVSWLNGELWIHNETSVYNNFYGVQYYSEIEVVGNNLPKKVKIWKAVSIEGNKPWECPTITTPENDLYPNGMLSRLKLNKFIGKEGVWYSELLNDMNTPGISDPIESLINGRELRGHVVNILFRHVGTDLVVMYSFNILDNYSEMSGRPR